jgi:hypothetical protein
LLRRTGRGGRSGADCLAPWHRKSPSSTSAARSTIAVPICPKGRQPFRSVQPRYNGMLKLQACSPIAARETLGSLRRCNHAPNPKGRRNETFIWSSEALIRRQSLLAHHPPIASDHRRKGHQVSGKLRQLLPLRRRGHRIKTVSAARGGARELSAPSQQLTLLI